MYGDEWKLQTFGGEHTVVHTDIEIMNTWNSYNGINQYYLNKK